MIFGLHGVESSWRSWAKWLLSGYNPRKKKCPFLSAEVLDLIHRRKAAHRKVLATTFQDYALRQQFRRLQTQTTHRLSLSAEQLLSCSMPVISRQAKTPLGSQPCHRSRSQVFISPSELNDHFCRTVTDETVSYNLP